MNKEANTPILSSTLKPENRKPARKRTEPTVPKERDKNIALLIVDDNLANVSLLEAILSTEYVIRSASLGSEALQSAQEHPPDLILLDIIMPGMNGYEVCERLKANPRLKDIPVIFLSINESADAKIKAFKSGGVDYITKPFQSGEVQARVRTHLSIRKLQLQLETQNKVLQQTSAERAGLAMIVESSHDAIFSLSPDEVITSWNRGAENILGYSAGEIIGCRVFTIIPAEIYQERSRIKQTILNGEQADHFETRCIKKDGSLIYASITTSPLLDAAGKTVGNSVIARDVTLHRQVQELIKHQAHHDVLTDLPNRHLFMDFLSLGMAQARRAGKRLALLFLDLNGFKQVNDTFGHSCGDRLLQEVAQRLRACIRASDTVARFGGDEFTILVPGLTQADDVGILLKKILGVFEEPFFQDGVQIDITISIGVCMFPDDGESSEELLKKADSAMYKAKESGSNTFRYYNSELSMSPVQTPAENNRQGFRQNQSLCGPNDRSCAP